MNMKEVLKLFVTSVKRVSNIVSNHLSNLSKAVQTKDFFYSIITGTGIFSLKRKH